GETAEGREANISRRRVKDLWPLACSPRGSGHRAAPLPRGEPAFALAQEARVRFSRPLRKAARVVRCRTSRGSAASGGSPRAVSSLLRQVERAVFPPASRLWTGHTRVGE